MYEELRQGKASFKENKFFLESPDAKILEKLLQDEVVRSARVVHPNAGRGGRRVGMSSMFETSFGLKEVGAEMLTDAIAQTKEKQEQQEGDENGAKEKDKNDIEEQLNKPEYDPSRSIHSFEIKPLDVEKSETEVPSWKSRLPSFRRVRFYQRYGESKLKRALETNDENSSLPGKVTFEKCLVTVALEVASSFYRAVPVIFNRHSSSRARGEILSVSVHVIGECRSMGGPI